MHDGFLQCIKAIRRLHFFNDDNELIKYREILVKIKKIYFIFVHKWWEHINN